MKIIVHSSISAQTITANLGKAEYSYYFVLAGYLPALATLGEVVTVDDPETEADAIFDAAQAAGEACVFLCFAPPHMVPINLRCPTIPVLAWEFSTIPCEVWGDDPRCDWRVVFAHCGRVIALSQHTAALVRAAMGADFPVFAIPTASYEAFAGIEPAPLPAKERVLKLHGYLFDSAAETRFAGNPPWPLVPAPHFGPAPVVAPVVAAPLVEAPAPPPNLRMRISKTMFYARGWYHDVLRDILPKPLTRLASAGGQRLYRRYKVRPSAVPVAVAAPAPPAPVLPECAVSLRGVVYSSVLAPQDGRKNWPDLLGGFVWAFRDNPDATLILKTPVLGGVGAYTDMHAILTRFAPFRCRVIWFAGFLDDAEYRDLVSVTNYYLNCSHAEGLCLPLMEFLSAGRPAVAPDHTAMADYIGPDIAFVLQGNLEHNVWPFDPRDSFTTMRYRLNWQSLVEALQESRALAIDEAERYAAMGLAAHQAMRTFCGVDVVRMKLAEALGLELPVPVATPGMVAA